MLSHDVFPFAASLSDINISKASHEIFKRTFLYENDGGLSSLSLVSNCAQEDFKYHYYIEGFVINIE